MLIVDSQVHIWAASTPERPWPAEGNPPHRQLPFSKDDLLREMDAAGVRRAVLATPGWEGDRNDLVLTAARLHPERFAVMGQININAPGARDRIAAWREQRGMLGLRFNFRIKGDSTDDWVWEEAEAAKSPIMVMSADQLYLVDRAAERHPELKLIIVHLGIPPRTKDDAAFAHLDTLLALAKRPNIAVKASSLPSYTTDSYPYRRLHPLIRRVYDAFGPKRMFWGTDLTRLPCSYRNAITLFTEELSWLTMEDKEWIMGRALCEWIGWKLL